MKEDQFRVRIDPTNLADLSFHWAIYQRISFKILGIKLHYWKKLAGGLTQTQNEASDKLLEALERYGKDR